jgi:hypothetical protein
MHDIEWRRELLGYAGVGLDRYPVSRKRRLLSAAASDRRPYGSIEFRYFKSPDIEDSRGDNRRNERGNDDRFSPTHQAFLISAS